MISKKRFVPHALESKNGPGLSNLQIWQWISSTIGLINWYFITHKQDLWRVRRSTSYGVKFHELFKNSASCCWDRTRALICSTIRPNRHFFYEKNLRLFLSEQMETFEAVGGGLRSMCVGAKNTTTVFTQPLDNAWMIVSHAAWGWDRAWKYSGGPR